MTRLRIAYHVAKLRLIVWRLLATKAAWRLVRWAAGWMAPVG